MGIGGCLAVLASACSDGGAAPDDDTEVLGIQVERDGSEAATFAPTEEPTVTASPTPDPVPDATPADTVGDPIPSDDATGAGSGPASPTTVAPTRPSPSPRPSAAPSPSPSPSPTPVALSTREGHSYVVWFRDEEPDGQGGSRYVWSEVSAAPVVTRDGSEPLRVTLVDLAGDPDRSAPRRAQCPAWIEVDGADAVRATGTLRVEVVVDGSAVSSGTRDIDVTVQPGERRDLVAIGDVRVAVPDVAEVTCRVTFTQGASG